MNKKEEIKKLEGIFRSRIPGTFQNYQWEAIARMVIESGYVPSPQWVSVKERMPELDSRILIAEPDGKGHLVGVCGYYMDSPKNCVTKGKPEFIDNMGDICFPTHWMPLPEAPETETP